MKVIPILKEVTEIRFNCNKAKLLYFDWRVVLRREKILNNCFDKVTTI